MGEGQFGMPVNSGEDVPLRAHTVTNNIIEAEEESCTFPYLQICNPLPPYTSTAFSVNTRLPLRVKVDAGGGNNALHLPGREGMVFWELYSIQAEKLLLAVADVLLPQGHHSFVLQRGVFPVSFLVRYRCSILQQPEIPCGIPGDPLVVCLRGNAEVAAGSSDRSLVLCLPEKPLKAVLGCLGKAKQCRDLALADSCGLDNTYWPDKPIAKEGSHGSWAHRLDELVG